MDSKQVVSAIETILKEKKIKKEKLTQIIEEIFFSILKKRFDLETDEEAEEYFSVTFNIEKGDVEIIHERIVVEDEDYESELTEIKLSDALKLDEDAEVDDEFPEIIDFSSFGRRNIATAKQILSQKIKKVERENLYERFKDKVGEIITGQIHQISPKEIKIHFEDIELIMPKSETVFNEKYRRGELIRVFIKAVEFDAQDVRIIVSRTEKDFIKKLFELEVPEIQDGIINITQIARIPGLRTKVILESLDSRIDPVGACIGQRGARISAIVSELNKEKIDIVQKIDEDKIFLTRLLGIKTEYQIEVDQDEGKVEIVIADILKRDVLGYRNSNVDLASSITGYKISVLSESEFEELNELKIETVKELDIETKEALLENGFRTAENVFTAAEEKRFFMDGFSDEKLDKIKVILNKYYGDAEEEKNSEK